jgi:hypothetical protein
VWTEARIAAARALWDEGLTTPEIAARLGQGCTKHAVVGLAHRHRWPPRASPIIRNGVRPEPVPRVPVKVHTSKAVPPARIKTGCRPVPTPPAPPRSPPVKPVGLIRTCQWIEGNARPYAMCGAPTRLGEVWCEHHHRTVFYRSQRQEAAHAIP